MLRLQSELGRRDFVLQAMAITHAVLQYTGIRVHEGNPTWAIIHPIMFVQVVLLEVKSHMRYGDISSL